VIKVSAGSFAATAANMDVFSKSMLPAIEEEALRRVGELLNREIVLNISLTDHSPLSLAALDHPYARRHGAIQIHTDKPYQVHTQSGAMLRALRKMLQPSGPGTGGAVFRIWFDLSAAPHAEYVVQGTKRMLQRDVLWDTATDREVRRRMMQEYVRFIGKEMRTKATVRFKATVRGSGSSL